MENTPRSLADVTPSYVIASCECFRGNYCPHREGRRVSHVEKQDVDTGKEGKVQSWDPQYHIPEHCSPHSNCHEKCKYYLSVSGKERMF